MPVFAASGLARRMAARPSPLLEAGTAINHAGGMDRVVGSSDADARGRAGLDAHGAERGSIDDPLLLGGAACL